MVYAEVATKVDLGRMWQSEQAAMEWFDLQNFRWKLQSDCTPSCGKQKADTEIWSDAFYNTENRQKAKIKPLRTFKDIYQT